MNPAWEIAVVLHGHFGSCCLSVCLIGESRISNKMPSTQSHIVTVFNSCPVLFALVLETVLACPLVLLLGTCLALIALGKCFYTVLSRGERLAV